MVHILSREEVKRIKRSGIGGSGGGGSEFDPNSLTGYATEAWCKDNFVTIAFFDQIFQVYNDQDKLAVNGELPVDTSKLNIKAMFGFWTDFYLTALGNGGEIGASIYLAGLKDVNVAGVQTGQVLTWNQAQNQWIATTPQSGVDMNQVWNALAAQTSQQINASHLTNALNGYATQTWVGQQGFATTAWVSSNFVTPTALATEMAKKVDVSFFDEIFQVFNNNTKIAVNGALPSDKSKMNIKAMFGFWTDFYLTALGNGGEIGASIYLAGLADVNVAGVQTGQVLTWKLDPSDNQYKWMATTPQSGVDMNQVWNALAAQTSQQINASHLSDALTGYATQTWVGQQGYITSAALNGYATESWVGQQGFATTAWVNQQGFSTTGWVNSQLANYLPLAGGAMVAGARISSSGGNLIIGNSNNAAWLMLQDVCSQNGASYWKIEASGNATFANVLSNGYVSALSDQREKNIIENFEVSLKYIAEAPVVSYTWKDTERRGDKQHIGSIAQYWLREMPELVPEVNGRYTMDYGRIALLSAILTARHVVNLEQRIAQLEKTLRGE